VNKITMPVTKSVTEALPEAVQRVTQVLVDNPGQFALIAAGTLVAARAAMNIVRPRTPLQALALFVVLEVGLPKAVMLAAEKGWLTFRVRDEDGQLVPLVIGEKCPTTTT
jgi:hypothetical protein